MAAFVVVLCVASTPAVCHQYASATVLPNLEPSLQMTFCTSSQPNHLRSVPVCCVMNVGWEGSLLGVVLAPYDATDVTNIVSNPG